MPTTLKLSEANGHNKMNTNRSYKLGTVKALKAFGARRGLAPYRAVQQVIAYKRLSAATRVGGNMLQKAFNQMAGAVQVAAIDFHQFARFVNHGPIQSHLDTQDHLTIAQICGDNPWYDAETFEGFKGSPGVSVQDLADLAQQYKYLHPGCDK